VLKQLLDEDGNFDGTTLAERQVGLVSARGGNAYTGATAQQADWAGAQGEGMLSVQGNGRGGAGRDATQLRPSRGCRWPRACWRRWKPARQRVASAAGSGRRRCWCARPAATGGHRPARGC
jgi:hypothetical protein